MIGTTERLGNDATLAGGIEENFFVVSCTFEDVSVSKGSSVAFFARSGILYDDRVYNDPVPDMSFIRIQT